MVDDAGVAPAFPMGTRKGDKQFLHFLTFQRLDTREIAYTRGITRTKRLYRLRRLPRGRARNLITKFLRSSVYTILARDAGNRTNVNNRICPR